MWRRPFLQVSCFLLMLLAVGCRPHKGDETIRLAGRTMGTSWSVALLPAAGGTQAAAVQRQLSECLAQINRLMSTYDPASEISRFNRQTGSDWFGIAEETAEVIELSLEISRLTGGAFDISVGPLVELWGFGSTPRSDKIPSAEQIAKALTRIGYQNLRLGRAPAALSKQIPELQLDLSAVAKGYAVDALAEILERQGVRNYLVEIGGELRVSGQRSDGEPWQIGLEKPQAEAREVARVFPLTDSALATSGNYRNFYLQDGQRYAHTLDPRSGLPSRHRLASVTVLDKSCARADALATALMVMGELKGRQFCEERRIAAYFLIYESGATTAYASPAFQALVTEVKE